MKRTLTIVEDSDLRGVYKTESVERGMIFDDEREELEYKLDFLESKLGKYLRSNGFTQEEIKFFDDAADNLLREYMKKISRMLRNA